MENKIPDQNYFILLYFWAILSEHIPESLEGKFRKVGRKAVGRCLWPADDIQRQTPHSLHYDRCCNLLGLCLYTCRILLQGYQHRSNQLWNRIHRQTSPYTAPPAKHRISEILRALSASSQFGIFFFFFFFTTVSRLALGPTQPPIQGVGSRGSFPGGKTARAWG